MTEPDITTRHGFLAALHDLLKPEVYLEVGVQYGPSLQLSHAARLAIGIDPNPLTVAEGNQLIIQTTADRFFDYLRGHDGDPIRFTAGRRNFLRPTAGQDGLPPIDLAFIDGMHLSEYALRDFANIHRYVHPRSVVVFDDVLPRNQQEARRILPGEPIVGDWTGDVWKVAEILRHGDLTLRLVNVAPTGLLLVTGLDRFQADLPPAGWVDILDSAGWLTRQVEVPSGVLNRSEALPPLAALQQIRTELVH